MAQTLFTDGVTLLLAAWANDVDASVYNTLSAVGGTATAITATGPTTVTAYAAGQRFFFTPAATNTGATTINISSIGAKSIFSNGAACVGSELKISVPTLIVYDGTQFNILASLAPRFKIVSFTRDTATASGTQAVTGVGFKPRVVVFLSGTVTGSGKVSVGIDDGTTPIGAFNNHNSTADTWGLDTSFSIELIESTPNFSQAKITTLGADGFTVTWTKTGTPTGSVTIGALCFS